MFFKFLEVLYYVKCYCKRELFDFLLKDYVFNDYLGLSVKKDLF